MNTSRVETLPEFEPPSTRMGAPMTTRMPRPDANPAARAVAGNSLMEMASLSAYSTRFLSASSWEATGTPFCLHRPSTSFRYRSA
jgi:hypothetical protein